jgi:hypothetical protein
MDAVKIEFMATADPCYTFFEIFKTSETDGDIDIQLNDDDLAIGAIINFTTEDTCGISLALAYKLYVYTADERILVSNGNLVVTPCCCGPDVEKTEWTDVNW